MNKLIISTLFFVALSGLTTNIFSQGEQPIKASEAYKKGGMAELRKYRRTPVFFLRFCHYIRICSKFPDFTSKSLKNT